MAVLYCYILRYVYVSITTTRNWNSTLAHLYLRVPETDSTTHDLCVWCLYHVGEKVHGDLALSAECQTKYHVESVCTLGKISSISLLEAVSHWWRRRTMNSFVLRSYLYSCHRNGCILFAQTFIRHQRKVMWWSWVGSQKWSCKYIYILPTVP